MARSLALASPGTQARSFSREYIIRLFVVVQFIALIVFQKIGVPVGGQVIPISLPLLWIGLSILFILRISTLNFVRYALFLLFLLFVLIGAATLPQFSLMSFGLVLAIYLPMLFSIRVSEAVYLDAMRLFVTLALLAVPLIFLQWGLQYFVRPGLWLNIERFLPRQVMVENYFYERLVAYGSAWAKPNAAVFLEVSILSQVLALAIVVELVCFRRLRKAVLLGIGLVATTAGTGILLLLICLPLLLRRLPRGSLLPGIALATMGVALVAVFGPPGVFERISELRSSTESGYYRFVAPLLVLGDFLDRGGDALWRGMGPGMSPKDLIVMLPFTKITFEYGVFASLSFYVFLLFSMFRTTYSYTIGFAVFVFYNLLGGGLSVPFYGLSVVLLTTIFVVDSEREHGGLPSNATRLAGFVVRPADKASLEKDRQAE